MPSPADDIWAAAARIAEALHQMHLEKVERQRVARNSRRRNRYAIRKAAGIIPRVKPPAIVEDEPDRTPGCLCHLGHPPCGFCEDGGTYCDFCGSAIDGGETCDCPNPNDTEEISP
jgi:hypothetical protein